MRENDVTLGIPKTSYYINNNNNPNTLNMDTERSGSVGRGLDWRSKAC